MKLKAADIIILWAVAILIIIIYLNINPIILNGLSSLCYERQIRYNPLVKEIAYNISKEVNERIIKGMGYYENYHWYCFIEATEYVNSIPYKEDSFFDSILCRNKDVDYTLSKGGDCENRAILFINIMEQLGVKDNYFVFQRRGKEYHLCVLSVVDNSYEFFDCFEDYDIIGIKKVKA